MPFQVSPGVNVSEIDLTTVVPAVSTTEGATVGFFQWGPVDQRILIDSEDRLVNIFGKPNADTSTYFFSSANFLAYGNALYVNRVINTDTYNAVAGNTTINNTLVKNEDHYNEDLNSRITGTDWAAKYPGDIGNSLKISVCQSANAWQQTITLPAYSVNNQSANVWVTTGSPASVTGSVIVGDLLLIGPDKEERQIKAIDTTTYAGKVLITLDTQYSGNGVTASTSITRRWEYFNYFDNAPGTSVFTTNALGADDEMHIAIADEDGIVTGVKGTVLEAFEAVSKASDAKTDQGAGNYYKNVVNQQSAYAWWGTHDAALTNAGSVAAGTTFGGSNLPVTNSFVGGADGTAVNGGQLQAGYDIFKSAEDVDVSFLLAQGGHLDPAVFKSLVIYVITNVAEYRKDCIAVVSPPRQYCVNNNSYAGKERDDIIGFRDLLPSSSYAVIDSGWKYQYDKYNDVYRYVPLMGDTAGLMVQTDLTRDPWWSPAGFNRGNVKNCIRLSYNPNKSDRDQLYKKGINPVVTFPGQGTVLFGDKTMLTKPSAFDRINVRRLFIVLEKAISTAAKFTLFEFNDEFTRSQFRNMVEPFLRDVQGRRGVTDFRVVCDSTNNTGEIIDRNEFVGDIYIKPARSINFIQLNFVAVRTGVEFSEVVGQF